MSRSFALLVVAAFAGPVAAQSKDDERREPKAGEVRKFEIADKVFMEFCWIPAGEAQLGSPKAERDAVAKQLRDLKIDEKTIAEILDDETESARGKFKTKGFWMAKNPVTQAQWKAVMKDNPSHFDGIKDNKAKGMATGQFPVESVSWEMIREKDGCFLEKVNKRPDAAKVFGGAGKFVLPHEDEWEYACRGGKGNKQAFYFGDELNGTQANCKGTEPYGTDKKGPFLDRPTPVGTYAEKFPHPWGLNDMHGNVWQWCENKYEQSNNRVLRGGSWYDGARYCRSAFRSRFGPDYRNYCFGFRVCLRLD